MILRKPVPSEFDSTVNLFSRYHQEAEAQVPSIAAYDENSVIETVKMFCSHYEYAWFNCYDNTRPVGFIAGYITQCPWNNSVLESHIAFIYLIESHRTLDNFRLLIGKFEEWSRICGSQMITAGDIGINPNRTQKLFEHFDFKPGVWLGKEINYEGI